MGILPNSLPLVTVTKASQILGGEFIRTSFLIHVKSSILLENILFIITRSLMPQSQNNQDRSELT